MTTGLLGHIGLKQEAAFGEEASPPEAFEEIISESIMMRSEQIMPRRRMGTAQGAMRRPGESVREGQ